LAKSATPLFWEFSIIQIGAFENSRSCIQSYSDIERGSMANWVVQAIEPELWAFFVGKCLTVLAGVIVFIYNYPGLESRADESANALWLFETGEARTAVDYLNGLGNTNYTLAQYEHFRDLASGGDTKRDLRELASYLKLVADQGLAEAQFDYAVMLSHRFGIPAAEAEAAEYFGLAADQRHAKAMYEFGQCLNRGRGVGQNSTEAIRYFRLAADLGVSDAQLVYGLSLLNDNRLVEGAKYLKLSADQNNLGGGYWYGLCLRDGKGVLQNRTAAAIYLKRSGDLGNEFAQHAYQALLIG
jgi:TPR repeat protein